MLEARGLTKWYGGVLSVSDVSFTIDPGEVLGVPRSKRLWQVHDKSVC
jgi:ABC-type phosphonate transport system ATPase subunit